MTTSEGYPTKFFAADGSRKDTSTLAKTKFSPLYADLNSDIKLGLFTDVTSVHSRYQPIRIGYENIPTQFSEAVIAGGQSRPVTQVFSSHYSIPSAWRLKALQEIMPENHVLYYGDDAIRTPEITTNFAAFCEVMSKKISSDHSLNITTLPASTYKIHVSAYNAQIDLEDEVLSILVLNFNLANQSIPSDGIGSMKINCYAPMSPTSNFDSQVVATLESAFGDLLTFLPESPDFFVAEDVFIEEGRPKLPIAIK
jgi:hypothetical protein